MQLGEGCKHVLSTTIHSSHRCNSFGWVLHCASVQNPEDEKNSLDSTCMRLRCVNPHIITTFIPVP